MRTNVPISCLLGLAAAVVFCGSARAARTAQQVERDLQSLNQQLEQYGDLSIQVQPRYRQWVGRQVAPLLQRKVKLLSELEEVDPRDKEGIEYQRDLDQAVLALAGDDKAASTLEQESKSGDATAALAAKLALAMRDWWSNQTPDAQHQVLARLVEMAKASPKDNMIAQTLVTLADAGAASEQLARDARGTVVGEMTGTFANGYKARPNKRGFPLVISGNTVQGKSFSTAPWKGKVVLVDFWATWCPPCRASLPKLKQIYDQYHDSGLEVVGISNDQDRRELMDFLKQNPGMVWPQLFGPSSSSEHWNRIAERFGVSAIPTVYLIDRNGILRTMDVARSKLEDLIRSYPKSPAAKEADGVLKEIAGK